MIRIRFGTPFPQRETKMREKRRRNVKTFKELTILVLWIYSNYILQQEGRNLGKVPTEVVKYWGGPCTRGSFICGKWNMFRE
jgi:hypothetical protein